MRTRELKNKTEEHKDKRSAATILTVCMWRRYPRTASSLPWPPRSSTGQLGTFTSIEDFLETFLYAFRTFIFGGIISRLNFSEWNIFWFEYFPGWIFSRLNVFRLNIFRVEYFPGWIFSVHWPFVWPPCIQGPWIRDGLNPAQNHNSGSGWQTYKCGLVKRFKERWYRSKSLYPTNYILYFLFVTEFYNPVLCFYNKANSLFT